MGSRYYRKLSKTEYMVDYTKMLNTYGNLSKQAFYINKTQKIPSCFVYSFDKKQIDLDTFDEKKIKELFPNVEEFWSTRNQTEITTSAVDDIVKDDDEILDEDIYIDGHYVNLSIDLFENNILWSFTASQISCYFICTVEEIKSKIKDLVNKLPFKEEKPKEAEVKLIAFDGRDYYTITSKVKPTDAKIEENYNDDFLPVYDDIVKFLDQRESGLVVMSGIPGTGKTTVIRHLLSQHPNEYIVVTNAIAGHLAQPEFIAFMLEHKDSIFILEDCEQILMDRSENTFGGAIANILNMSDGLLSDIFNIKFICTFNADINKIDQALLRKGRCYANYEFKPLSKEKVTALNEKYKLNLPEIKEMTLAEIYNFGILDNYQSQETHKKIGF